MGRGTTEETKEHLKAIKFLMVANFPIIYITSWEEDRIGAAISEISADLGKQVISWSCTEGLIKGGKRVAAANKVNPHTLFFVCPVLYIPDELQKDITYVDFPNPREREAVWRVQFRRHKQSVPKEGLDELGRLTKGFQLCTRGSNQSRGRISQRAKAC